MASAPEDTKSDTKGQVGELVVERTTPAIDIPKDVHSIFTTFQKKMIVLTASTAALFSPLSSNIYLPALNLLAEEMNVSNSQINFTVTSYLVFVYRLLLNDSDDFRSFKHSHQ
jgi:hypothetical protein